MQVIFSLTIWTNWCSLMARGNEYHWHFKGWFYLTSSGFGTILLKNISILSVSLLQNTVICIYVCIYLFLYIYTSQYFCFPGKQWNTFRCNIWWAPDKTLHLKMVKWTEEMNGGEKLALQTLLVMMNSPYSMIIWSNKKFYSVRGAHIFPLRKPSGKHTSLIPRFGVAGSLGSEASCGPCADRVSNKLRATARVSHTKGPRILMGGPWHESVFRKASGVQIA